ncbi:MAG: hypothetical protein AB8B55_05800 [Mariniblastus sp.]
MFSIPKGDWAVESILINGTTVMNNDGMRGLEILDDEWVIQPVGQRFKVRQSTSKTAVLESNGEVFYADFEVRGSDLRLQLARENRNETVCIEAIAITADCFVATM